MTHIEKKNLEPFSAVACAVVIGAVLYHAIEKPARLALRDIGAKIRPDASLNIEVSLKLNAALEVSNPMTIETKS